MAGRLVRARVGSSPLARGLPATLCSECSAYRIIPARAGFTMYCPLRPERNRDHPRSRGVYGMLDFGDTIEEGIIPARAGFTTRPIPVAASRADHPRSRGVYENISSMKGTVMGSSPLARGLHRHVHSQRCLPRIIPARAGFTASRSPPRSTTADHPRSRGVYARMRSRHRLSVGSSPLARGLLPK